MVQIVEVTVSKMVDTVSVTSRLVDFPVVMVFVKGQVVVVV